jgi:hypothetical protein
MQFTPVRMRNLPTHPDAGRGGFFGTSTGYEYRIDE